MQWVVALSLRGHGMHSRRQQAAQPLQQYDGRHAGEDGHVLRALLASGKLTPQYKGVALTCVKTQIACAAE
jgi:hypothetical protein